MSLLSKIQNSDIPPSDYEGDYLDDEGLDYLAKVYEDSSDKNLITYSSPHSSTQTFRGFLGGPSCFRASHCLEKQNDIYRCY